MEVAFINILGLYWALSIRKKGVELRRNDANRSKMYNKRLFPPVKGIYIRFALQKLVSVEGPVIQANGKLSFEDDLRSG